jgi:hypothetical protein
MMALFVLLALFAGCSSAPARCLTPKLSTPFTFEGESGSVLEQGTFCWTGSGHPLFSNPIQWNSTSDKYSVTLALASTGDRDSLTFIWQLTSASSGRSRTITQSLLPGDNQSFTFEALQDTPSAQSPVLSLGTSSLSGA